MINHSEISDRIVWRKIKEKEIDFGGNKALKIYGTLQCKSGKRMNRSKRVFFDTEMEAVKNGYRPCGHCMKSEYQKWKNEIV